MQSVPFAVALFSILAALASAQQPIEPLTERSSRALHAAVVPRFEESWQTIPWRVELESAAREAQSGGRLLFLWTMNGHPLGCT